MEENEELNEQADATPETEGAGAETADGPEESGSPEEEPAPAPALEPEPADLDMPPEPELAPGLDGDAPEGGERASDEAIANATEALEQAMVAADAPEEEAEEEKKKPRSLLLTFLSTMAVMAAFIIGSIFVLMTDGEDRVISILFYSVGAFILIYLLLILPAMDADKAKSEEQKAEEKAKRKARTKKQKAVGTLSLVGRCLLLTVLVGGGLVLILVSKVFCDMVAISMMFVCMLAYFATFQNL